jgi:glycerate 2-kinase
MKIVLAPDSFKGSMTATQACVAMAKGISRVRSDVEIVSLPLADGGEGTVEALVMATAGQLVQVPVIGSLGDKVSASFGILGPTTNSVRLTTKVAVIEIAAAAGLPLVPPQHRNPLHTTTYGMGQLINAALEQGCRHFIIGLGGSATNDCGTGMLQALGIKFFDQQNNPIIAPMTGLLNGQIHSIDFSDLIPELKQCSFMAACDVDNPLLGPRGATYVYGPQKGADATMLAVLEKNMAHIIALIEAAVGKKVRNVPGAGAAGGLGAALLAFLDARLGKGIDLVMRYVDFNEKIRTADLIITAEGRIDASTVFGKTIHGVAITAATYGIPVIALAGSVAPEGRQLLDYGVKAMLSLCPGPITLQQAMSNGPEFLADVTEQAFRLITLNLRNRCLT